ncbi:hypothetical protein [Pseudogracilibacillus sp. SO30301A]|uniref:hypothetical protein n=1 Tax=Pseudogracilibacillus sp. SO30301A TaxID=3098291 RepID=UPI00300E035C
MRADGYFLFENHLRGARLKRVSFDGFPPLSGYTYDGTVTESRIVSFYETE